MFFAVLLVDGELVDRLGRQVLAVIFGVRIGDFAKLLIKVRFMSRGDNDVMQRAGVRGRSARPVLGFAVGGPSYCGRWYISV